VPDGPGGLLDWLARIEDSVAELRDQQRAGHERAAARELVIDRLHEENQRLRAGETQLLLRPILIDLQRLRNELLRESAALPEVVPAARVADLLRSLSVSVELTLERGGVTVIRPAVGDAFDPARHRAASATGAAGPEEDGTIAEVLGDGYLDTVTDRVVAPATVLVRRWAAVTGDKAKPTGGNAPVAGDKAKPTGDNDDQGDPGHGA
jgi:molecular chaperone GrpE